jgi:hypothetical protein
LVLGKLAGEGDEIETRDWETDNSTR